MMIDVTIDTNCIINLFDEGSETRTSVDELQSIISLYDSGKINIFLTTRFDFDELNDKDEQRLSRIASGLKSIKEIDRIGSCFVWGESTWDGGDMFIEEKDKIILNKIENIMFSKMSKEKYGKNEEELASYRIEHKTNEIYDVEHIFAHYKSGNDMFVTDDGDMLKKSQKLDAEFGIQILQPDSALMVIRSVL